MRDATLFMVEAEGRRAQLAADLFAEAFWSEPRQATPVNAVGRFSLRGGRCDYRVARKTMGGIRYWAVERV